MNIKRHNYEEYFILYLDNELSSGDRLQVELFVKENPDLQEELNLLMQTQLVPDSSFVFAGKEQLLKTSGTDSINTTNYEEWLLSYADNELSAEQKIAVDYFIANHPAAKAELEFLQKTKLQPDPSLAFANKEILYRKEEKVRVIAIHWRRIAVAVALLLAASTTALLVFNNKEDNQENIAAEKVEAKKSIQDNPAIKQPIPETSSITNPQVADNSNVELEKKTMEISNPVAKKETRIEQKEKSNYALPGKVKQNDAIVFATKEKKNMNDLPQPVHNPNVNRVAEQDNPIAKVDPVKEKEPLTNLKETNSVPTVTPNTTEPLYTSNTSTGTDDLIDVNQPGKKNKLRGFFRKVTRTFEKNTNIKATDDEDRLLLGGLAIKL